MVKKEDAASILGRPISTKAAEMAKVKGTRNYQVTLPEEVRKRMIIEQGEYVEIIPIDRWRALLRKIILVEKLAGTWDEEMDQIMEEIRKLWRTWKL